MAIGQNIDFSEYQISYFKKLFLLSISFLTHQAPAV